MRTWAGNIFLGVCGESAALNNYCGNDEHGFGYCGCSNAYRRGTSKRYGEAFRSGDVIRVKLDMEKRNLQFAKNGKDLGIGNVCLFVSFSIGGTDMGNKKDRELD